MKNYLSFGGGVNSTAMLLVLHDEGIKFESIYVDHGGDWPETIEYVQMISIKYPITILKPSVDGIDNLYDYSFKHNVIPTRIRRWCTDKFKISVINKYIERPCFQMIGFSTDEAHRAKISITKGVENRFPLLERDIDRNECIKIIESHGFRIPMKSGCYFCPFQRVGQWRKLREEHPDLFCKALALEHNEVNARRALGKSLLYLTDKRLDIIVNEKQMRFEGMELPPCSCGL